MLCMYIHIIPMNTCGCCLSQITLSLRSTVEQLLHDLHTVRQEYKKLESLAQQMTVEKNELLLRMQYLESLEVKLEHSQKTVGCIGILCMCTYVYVIYAHVHTYVQDVLTYQLYVYIQ